MDRILSGRGMMTLFVLTVAICLALTLYLLVIDDIWAIIWDTHPHPDEADPERSPFHTIEVIDGILASDEHVAPLLAVNHACPGGILNESGISTMYLEADFENESVERYRITVDTPQEAVVAIEPVETFPSWCYPNITEENFTIP